MRAAIDAALHDDDLRARVATAGPALARERSLDRYIEAIGSWLFSAGPSAAR
jgi:hypothetical protein